MNKIELSDIYDKNLNFLIGSGASFDLFPTLALNINKGSSEEHHTIESLATQFETNDQIKTLLFSRYVNDVIKPAAQFKKSLPHLQTDSAQKVLSNYDDFLRTLISVLQKNRENPKCNIFTTNYDGQIAHSGDRLLESKSVDFVLNNGSSGFKRKVMDVKNYGRTINERGAFERYSRPIPQINLIEMHGSVYWYKENENIEISYDRAKARERLEQVPDFSDDTLNSILDDASKSDADLVSYDASLTDQNTNDFWTAYNKLPIVNPTKWKFYETVFEEHYYSLLRYMSYELERPNTVLIVFGFSFADEHILSLVKRSLSNPNLQVFMCCYNDDTEQNLKAKFAAFSNIEYVRVDGNLDFTKFNEEVLQQANFNKATQE